MHLINCIVPPHFILILEWGDEVQESLTGPFGSTLMLLCHLPERRKRKISILEIHIYENIFNNKIKYRSRNNLQRKPIQLKFPIKWHLMQLLNDAIVRSQNKKKELNCPSKVVSRYRHTAKVSNMWWLLSNVFSYFLSPPHLIFGSSSMQCRLVIQWRCRWSAHISPHYPFRLAHYNL